MTDVGEKKIEPVRNCCYSCKLLARFVARPPNFFQKWSRLTRLFAMTVTKTWRCITRNFGGLYSRKRSCKMTNRSARSNWEILVWWSDFFPYYTNDKYSFCCRHLSVLRRTVSKKNRGMFVCVFIVKKKTLERISLSTANHKLSLSGPRRACVCWLFVLFSPVYTKWSVKQPKTLIETTAFDAFKRLRQFIFTYNIIR